MGALARLWGDVGHKVNILITGVLAVKPAQFSLIRTELTEVECIIAHTEMISIEARITDFENLGVRFFSNFETHSSLLDVENNNLKGMAIAWPEIS